MRVVLLSISTILFGAGHQHLHAQQVTTQEPLPSAPTPPQPPTLNLADIPRASILPTKPSQHAVLESDTQSRRGDIYLLAGDVVITYADHVLRADTVTYDAVTGEATAEGHVRLTGGENDEYINASHGTYNITSATGRFYDVNGSVALHTGRNGYVTANPFLFSGRLVVKTGPEHYDIYDGYVTSCLLPNPDWQLFAKRFTLDDGKAKASNSVFKLLHIPVLFLPFVTHPVDSDQRQSGILIPVVGYSEASKDTGSKGLTLGEQLYLTLGRSADLTVGTIYYSLRGFSENATFRLRGAGDDFFDAHFSALQDRGFTNNTGLYINQGGEDVTAGFRHQFTVNTRAVGDAEYLSSYVYREVFTENFNQAVSTDILSTLYLTRQNDGYSLDGRIDRYEGLKVVPINTTPGEEVKIFHAPSIDFTAMDHPIAGTPLLWSMTSSFAGLKRVQPNFSTTGITERFDLRPELALPIAFQGWHVLASVSARETVYSRSRQAPYDNGATPVELNQAVNRGSVETDVDIRPPVLERTFTVPQNLRWIFGSEVRHTIEPEITYRDVQGVNNFLSILRFDDIDLFSDTNELQYALTQHLYFRPVPKRVKPKPGCPAVKPSIAIAQPVSQETTALPDAVTPEPQASNDANGIPNASATAPDSPMRTHAHRADPCAPSSTPTPQQEWFSWKLAQKHFFDQTFGGGVIDRRRNIFDTTLDLSGVAFLTEPRSISPLISRMRFRTSSHSDFEWDVDYDTGATKVNSSNIFVDTHEGPWFGGFSYALLNAPGRFYTEVIDPVTNTATGLTSSGVSNFSQMRVLAGYGTPTKPGFSAAGSAGIDLNAGTAQYITIQSSYNWNCCGLTVELRHYDLGTLRNEYTPTFSFTLANIGAAGNIRRSQQLF